MFERIWAMGDIHGSYYPIDDFWRRNKDNIDFSKETDCIILLGDVGANYYLNGRDNKFKQKLSNYPFTYFCIRGNHEERVINVAFKNEENWIKESFFGNMVWVEKAYPNIKYALDYPMMYNIKGYKTLVLPGAYSADKPFRLMKKFAWFSQEQMTPGEMDLGKRILLTENYKVDLILSHTCPIIYEPSDLFLPMIDQSTVDRSMERYFGEIEYATDYKLWLWGHFHAYRIYPKYNDSQCIMLSDGKEAINVLEWLEQPNEIHQRY